MLYQNTSWWIFLIIDAYQETWILKLSFGIVWLAFLPRAQEVKIAYVSPETEKFDKGLSYVCHFIQQNGKTV
jgi:hypothetical protein